MRRWFFAQLTATVPANTTVPLSVALPTFDLARVTSVVV